jgi:hypothetical protein
LFIGWKPESATVFGKPEYLQFPGLHIVLGKPEYSAVSGSATFLVQPSFTAERRRPSITCHIDLHIRFHTQTLLQHSSRRSFRDPLGTTLQEKKTVNARAPTILHTYHYRTVPSQSQTVASAKGQSQTVARAKGQSQTVVRAGKSIRNFRIPYNHGILGVREGSILGGIWDISMVEHIKMTEA